MAVEQELKRRKLDVGSIAKVGVLNKGVLKGIEPTHLEGQQTTTVTANGSIIPANEQCAENAAGAAASVKPTHSEDHIPDPPADLTQQRLAFASKRQAAAGEGAAPVFDVENDLILRTAAGTAASSSSSGEEPRPIWAMRQAGRYLPEFRGVRSLTSFFEVCHSPKLAAEVTLQPLLRFPELDAVIIFSDILVVPVAMGMECKMVPGEGPKFPTPLGESPSAAADVLAKLDLRPNVEKTLGYVFDAIHWTWMRLGNRVPVIGFSGAPWTLLAYMIEGGGSKTWNKAKKWLYLCPEESRKLLTALTDVVIEYLVAQYDAGASLLQVFDTNAGELPPSVYAEFCVADLKRIASEIKRQRPKALITVFAKDTELAPFDNSAYNVVGVSWKQCPTWARQQCPSKILQGNLDPVFLYGSADEIEKRAQQMLRAFDAGDSSRNAKRHICNLGHGMLPDHKPEGLGAYIRAVKSSEG